MQSDNQTRKSKYETKNAMAKTTRTPEKKQINDILAVRGM